MKLRKVAVLAVLALFVLALVGCGAKSASTTEGDKGAELSGSITVQGSDTMVNMAQAWAEAFQTKNPGVTVSVTGGGSGTGIAALLNGTVDFANASRQLKDEESVQAKDAGVNPVETVVAKDGIAVLVNPDNAVADLSVDQLGQIYRGEITNWKQVGGADAPIVLLGRDTASGTYEFFQEFVVGKDKTYAKSMKNLQSSQAIVDEVTKNPNAIGYVGIGYVKPGVKALTLGGIAPSAATVTDKSYALARDLYVYSNGVPSGAAKAYIDWVLSADGQKIVADQGFVALSK